MRGSFTQWMRLPRSQHLAEFWPIGWPVKESCRSDPRWQQKDGCAKAKIDALLMTTDWSEGGNE